MCKYCEKEIELPIEFESAISDKEEDFVLVQRIVENKMFITANLGFINTKGKPSYRSTLSKVSINFCPMCGRKLGDKNEM